MSNARSNKTAISSSVILPKECPKGFTGDKCDKVDACAKNNPCKDGNHLVSNAL